jgi:hypothetical protein
MKASPMTKLQRESGDEVAEGEMPPRLHTPLHPHAVLPRADKQVIDAWARGGRRCRGSKATAMVAPTKSANWEAVNESFELSEAAINLMVEHLRGLTPKRLPAPS